MLLRDVKSIENPMVLADPCENEVHYPRCPICGSDEYEDIYFGEGTKIIGCSDCAYAKTAGEYTEIVAVDKLDEQEYYAELKAEQEYEESKLEQ